MASLLTGLGSLFALLGFVVLTHALQIGVLIMGLAMAAGLAMLLRDARVERTSARTTARTVPVSDLPRPEQLAVELAEEPSERVPAPRPVPSRPFESSRH